MTEKELIAGFLSKTLNMDDAGVASLYNEDGTVKTDALSILETADIARVTKLKPDTKKVFDDGYKKATSEVMSKFENDLKEKIGFVSDKKGLELILDYVAEQSKKTGAITDDDIKKHPVFISTVDRLAKEKTEAITAESEKLTKFQKELSTKETFSKVGQTALEIFHKLKPILSKDPIRIKAQEALFLKELKEYEYDIQDGNIIVLKDGKVLEDRHSNRVTFEKIAKDITLTNFDLHITDPKGSAGNGKPNGQTESVAEVIVPKNDAEYAKAIADQSKSIAERTAIKTAYRAQST